MRKTTALVAALLIFSTISCKKESPHLPPEQMVPVLADLHLADVYSGLLHTPGQPAQGKNMDSLALWTKSIFAAHHITREEFTASMNWYRDRPEELDSLYAKVIPYLSAMQHP